MLGLSRPYKTWRPLAVDFRHGRWSGSLDPHELPLPRITVFGEGDDCAYAAILFGTRGNDPAFRIEVQLDGTRLARAICHVAAWWRSRG